MTNKNISNRVKAGIAFLNVVEPDWLKRIDLEKLDLSNSKTCILGEVYGNYYDGRDKLDLNEEIAEKLGFAEEENRPNYKSLTAAWKETLKPMIKKI